MKSSSITPLPLHKSWDRDYFLAILETAMEIGAFRYARQIALKWLSTYPGDLPVQFIHAKALIRDDKTKQAIAVLEKINSYDPEFVDSQELLARIQKYLRNHSSYKSTSRAKALGSRIRSNDEIPQWSILANSARKALERNDIDQAQKLAQQALASEPESPIAAITHLRTLIQQDSNNKSIASNSIQKIAAHYQNKWPDCIQFTLISAHTLMNSGESDKAVSLLHQASARDITGQVASRLWGDNHPYKDLWPKTLACRIGVPIPADVAAVMGWNQLPKSVTDYAKGNKENIRKIIEQPSSTAGMKFYKQDELSESLVSVRREFNKVAKRMKKSGISHERGRYPIYVILTSKLGLIEKYGSGTANLIHEHLETLAGAVRNKDDWGAALVYIDDAKSMSSYNLKPLTRIESSNIKQAVNDLDRALYSKGARIGALTIVGGPEIIPFHHLPNPTDDQDTDVPSDNPYCARDENYFIPEWPIGRLPGGEGKDPGLLLSLIRESIEFHTQPEKRPQSLLVELLNIISYMLKKNKRRDIAYGFTAEVWLQASKSVFRTIGDPQQLNASPPERISNGHSIPPVPFGYFNLHGVAAEPKWFGQKAPSSNTSGGDYPLVIQSSDLDRSFMANNGNSLPRVVFSEACYGAHILRKHVEEALPLKFLLRGSNVFIGSTVIAYGDITAKLTGADLLAKEFWKYLKAGLSVGESLLKAKVSFAQIVNKRKGYLDAEDQKALISFVLYGDPLYKPDIKAYIYYGNANKKGAQNGHYERLSNPSLSIQEEITMNDMYPPVSDAVMSQVKHIVKDYLPGMENAKVQVRRERIMSKSRPRDSSQKYPKNSQAVPNNIADRRVIVMKKEIKQRDYIDYHYARITLNDTGKVVKFSVSK